MDKRIHELLELVESEGLTLPHSVAFIAWAERKGHVVNLETGEILLNQANQPAPYVVTPAGLAALQAGEGDVL